MLRNILKLVKDAISKNLFIFKVFLKKVFKFFLCHQILGFKTRFFVMLLLNYYFAKKQVGKRDPIWLVGLDNFKIIFILLVEIIAI